jgi:predicted small lipoprotein YifL
VRLRTAAARILPGASLAVLLGGLLAGCGLKGPLYLPEKPGDVTIRPAPTPPAAPSPGAPATGSPATDPAAPGSATPSPSGPAVPDTSQAPGAGLPESSPSGTGGP